MRVKSKYEARIIPRERASPKLIERASQSVGTIGIGERRPAVYSGHLLDIKERRVRRPHYDNDVLFY